MVQPASTEQSRLLGPRPPTSPVVDSTPTNAASEALWNVFQLVHGAGEAFRGTVLGAIDSIDHTGETKHHEIARKGKEEINVALARLWGTGSSVQAAPSGTPGAASGYDVGQGQPPAYQSIGDTGAGFRPDNKTGAP